MRRRQYGEKGLVKFSVGEIFCAVEIQRVEEIVRPLRVSALASPSDLVLGMADYRGQIVPVVDACAGFAGTHWQAGGAARWIVGRGAGRLVALAVDTVDGVTTTPADWEEGNYPVKQGQDLIIGVTRVEGDLVLLVDLDRLIRQHVGTPKMRRLSPSTDRERS